MAAMDTQTVTETVLNAVVVRCTCGQPATHAGKPCPAGRDENLGTIAYWHRNPLRRALWAIVHRTRGKD